MSKNPSALASLTANYTDSENEDGHDSDEKSPRTDDSNESQVCRTSFTKVFCIFLNQMKFLIYR